MTNRIALVLAIIILGLFATDFVLNDGRASLFLGVKFAALVDYIKFWR
jgi:hypothetical protein